MLMLRSIVFSVVQFHYTDSLNMYSYICMIGDCQDGFTMDYEK
jgi:hypothetical protein